MKTAFNKVATITLWFWVLKILATTLGETSGDLLAITLNLGYIAGLAIASSVLAVLLAAQLASSRFRPALYWAAIVGTTTAGTEVSDLMDRTLHLGYLLGAAILATCLLSTLGIWRLVEGELRVSPIVARRRELFYWTAILFSNSLGTAFGDFLSDSLGLGYISGAALTAAIIGVVVALHYTTRINGVALFWVAFVFTRPFGATFGDFLTKPTASGGLHFSTLTASAVAVMLMVIIIAATGRGDARRAQRHLRARSS
ncbi:hypothetical protein [Salinisphaera sp.]|uniref:COG4705 family protein n=1 Tax=Salinisphaera sp. TaxID=1914330 RepID=UPI002D77E34F|nr:hypothetical protein [Salinisphaera sp.]HET7314336.1 hypothetical protein [Salinisphaera sp.]